VKKQKDEKEVEEEDRAKETGDENETKTEANFTLGCCILLRMYLGSNKYHLTLTQLFCCLSLYCHNIVTTVKLWNRSVVLYSYFVFLL
jgi:hypothetical protein